MATIELLKKLKKYPVFGTNEIEKILKKDQQYCRTVIYRLKKKTLIAKIEKDKYTLMDDVIKQIPALKKITREELSKYK